MASNKPHLVVFMPLCSPYRNGLIVTDKVWWKTRYVTPNTSSEKTLASALLSPGSLTQRKTSTMLWGHSSSPGEVCLAGNWALSPTASTTLSDTWASHFASRSSSPNSAFRWLHQFLISVAQSCPTLSDSTDCSTPGFPGCHQPPEIIQTHVHQVGDAIQPSHPLLSPSPPAFNLSQHQGIF